MTRANANASVSAMEEKLNMLLSIVSETKEMLASSLIRIDKLEKEVTSLCNLSAEQDKQIHVLKNIVNVREQQSKANSVRLLGFPLHPDESASNNNGGLDFATRVYRTILHPILSAAVTNGALSSLPSLSETISHLYRAGKSASEGRPAPIVITFVSSSIRLAVLRNKRTNTPSPSAREKTAGILNYVIVEDLTGPTLKCLKSMKEDKRILKVWTIEGRIRFSLASDPRVIFKVSSVFDNVDFIIEHISA